MWDFLKALLTDWKVYVAALVAYALYTGAANVHEVGADIIEVVKALSHAH